MFYINVYCQLGKGEQETDKINRMGFMLSICYGVNQHYNNQRLSIQAIQIFMSKVQQ